MESGRVKVRQVNAFRLESITEASSSPAAKAGKKQVDDAHAPDSSVFTCDGEVLGRGSGLVQMRVIGGGAKHDAHAGCLDGGGVDILNIQ